MELNVPTASATFKISEFGGKLSIVVNVTGMNKEEVINKLRGMADFFEILPLETITGNLPSTANYEID